MNMCSETSKLQHLELNHQEHVGVGGVAGLLESNRAFFKITLEDFMNSAIVVQTKRKANRSTVDCFITKHEERFIISWILIGFLLKTWRKDYCIAFDSS